MPPKRNALARSITAGATLAFLRISSGLPLRFNRAAAVPAGRLLARVVPRVRRIAMDNLDLAYGDSLSPAEKGRIVRGAVDNLALNAAEFAHLGRIVEHGGGDAITIEGADHIDSDQGCLCISAHLGNWELMAPLMATVSRAKIAVVVRPFDDPRVDRAIDGIRTCCGVRTIPKDKAGQAIVRHLKEGYQVGLMIDQSPRENGVPVTFFGEPCWATVAPVMVAVRARVPIVPVSLTRQPGGRYLLRFHAPVEMERTGNLRADLLRNSQRCQDAIEELVRANPEQWLWFHRRWKPRPRLAAAWKRREEKDSKCS